ncbi:MAG: iron ABC transporter permease, partial [Cyanobacteria bacterium J06641_5]
DCARSAERAQSYLLWTFGSCGNTTLEQLPLFAGAIAIALLLALLGAKPLNALLLGETYARSLGLDLGRARWQILASTALLAGTVTAFCGPVAFLGVAVPHLCRGYLKLADHRYLLPGTALTGATLALCANLVAQLPGSQFSLPLNAVLALIGAPVVAWVVLQRPSGDV